MPIYVLDTDILSLHQRNHKAVTDAVRSHASDSVSISTVTIEEQISGWSALGRSAKNPQQLEFASAFLAALSVSWGSFAVLPLTVAAIARFTALWNARLNVKKNDLRIAAIALEAGATVVTRNRRDFGRVAGLQIEDWSV